MAKNYLAIPLALAVVLGTPMAAFAQQDPNMDPARPGGQPVRRGDVIRMTGDERIADLPAGHWATNATQVAVANNVLTLENGLFYGDRELTTHELGRALETMVNTAENIAGKGPLPELRAAVGILPRGEMMLTRLELAQVLANFLDAANHSELLAVAAPAADATRFRDLGAAVPPAVMAVVDKYKVMTGYPDLTFRPSHAVSRFQLAAIAKEILGDMRQAPIAQLPVATTTTTVVVAPPPPEEIVPPLPSVRANFRQNAPIHLGWQALNQDNLTTPDRSFNVIPVSAMLTGYQGPVMLQNVTNFRYDLFQNNLVDSEFRLGFADMKMGMVQLLPYVGANVGMGASIPTATTQYDTYAGVTYGGIISVMPLDNLEFSASIGQSALLGAGRWNQNFQPMQYPAALGTFLTNYGLAADFYVAPNIALTLGLSSWQAPADLRTAELAFSGKASTTLGGNLGIGFGF